MIPNDQRASKAQRIASAAARQVVSEGIAAGLSWTDIVISCETVVVIVVASAMELEGMPANPMMATRIIDLMCRRAQDRVVTYLQRGGLDA